MKLINRKTGQIAVFGEGIVDLTKIGCNNVAEMIEAGWEDYKKPKSTIKDVWFNSIIADAHIVEIDYISDEEAEKAVEKIKAWKRLKDAGCKIVGWDYSDNVDLNGCKFNDDDFIIGLSAGDINEEDLDLLFGGDDETDN